MSEMPMPGHATLLSYEECLGVTIFAFPSAFSGKAFLFGRDVSEKSPETDSVSSEYGRCLAGKIGEISREKIFLRVNQGTKRGVSGFLDGVSEILKPPLSSRPLFGGCFLDENHSVEFICRIVARFVMIGTVRVEKTRGCKIARWTL